MSLHLRAAATADLPSSPASLDVRGDGTHRADRVDASLPERYPTEDD